MAKTGGTKLIANNKKARHDYFVEDEEDMGIEGLRKAKESYRPVKMIKKFTAIFKG